jgi:hypothetical protein
MLPSSIGLSLCGNLQVFVERGFSRAVKCEEFFYFWGTRQVTPSRQDVTPLTSFTVREE